MAPPLHPPVGCAVCGGPPHTAHHCDPPHQERPVSPLVPPPPVPPPSPPPLAPPRSSLFGLLPIGPQRVLAPTTVPPKPRRRSLYSAQHVTLAIRFSDTTYRLVWLTLFALRLACAAFLVATAQLYWFIAHPYMGYYANLLGPNVVANYPPMGVCFALVACLQAYQLLSMVYWSCQYRTLVVGPSPQSLGPIADTQFFFRDWRTRFHSPRVFYASLKRDVWRLCFDRHGPFGVESAWFYGRILCAELLEITSQTALLHTASVLVSTVWLNDTLVALTVLNCWSTPLVRLLFSWRNHRNHNHHHHQELRKNEQLHNEDDDRDTAVAWERFVVLALDFVLDATTAMAVPLLLFLPYYRAFDLAIFSFETALVYDDIWFVNMVMECQQLLAQSKWDFWWKMVPHLSIYGSLNSMRALLRPPRALSRGAVAPHQAHVRVVVSSPRRSGSEEPHSFTQHDSKKPTHVPPPRLRGLQNVVTLVLFAWGLAILALHVRAAHRAQLEAPLRACVTRTRPWFPLGDSISCSVVRFNCYAHNATTITNADLAQIDPTSVGALVLSHCAHLEMPSCITQFRNLVGIDLYNVTLAKWDVDAAISASGHPRFTYLVFVYTNMTRLPDGILVEPLPASMTDFEIAVSNLTELPLDLHEKWHTMPLLYMEHTLVTQFPPTLLHLHVEDLSLIGNHAIETLPPLPAHHEFYSLGMTHTSLKELPPTIDGLEGLGFLYLGYTQLTELPAWLELELSETATKIHLHHTPWCARKSESEIQDKYSAAHVLTCVADESDDERQQVGMYPLAIMAPRRPLVENW